jgi:hypothetical protein
MWIHVPPDPWETLLREPGTLIPSLTKGAVFMCMIPYTKKALILLPENRKQNT